MYIVTFSPTPTQKEKKVVWLHETSPAGTLQLGVFKPSPVRHGTASCGLL